ncbi:Integrase core domain protein [compost metagenome]
MYVEIATSISTLRETRTLKQSIGWRGRPPCLRVDNVTEFTIHHLELLCKDQGIVIKFIQPGKPMQNCYIERFNRSFRKEILDAYLFFNFSETREHTQHGRMNIITKDRMKGLGISHQRNYQKIFDTNNK